MNNKYLLDERLNIIGLSKDDLAKKLGINVKSLYRRLAGAQDFTQTELQKIKDVLNLNTDDFMKIFFVETKKFSVTGFKQLLGSTDWQHETIVDEKGIIIATDRDFTEHAKSWGYVTKISTLKDDFVIKYIRMYSYFNYMPDSLTYIAQNELGENLNLCYNGFEVVDDTGKSLNASEVESVVKQFSRFTKFDDVEYKYFDVVDVVGNGTHKTVVACDYAPTFEVHYNDFCEFGNHEWNAKFWDYVKVFDLGDDETILVAVENHFLNKDDRPSYYAKCFLKDDFERVNKWLYDYMNDEDLVEQVMDSIMRKANEREQQKVDAPDDDILEITEKNA